MRTPHAQQPKRPEPDGRPPEGEQRREITDALLAWRGGVPDALERLMPLVYDQLRRIARRQLEAERSNHTLSTTGLVHEAYLRLVDQTRVEWSERSHFFAVAAQAMRRVLVDYARKHSAKRRGGGLRPLPIDMLEDPAGADADAIAVIPQADQLLEIDEALDELAQLDPRLVRVIECRYFAGMTDAETARALDITPRTVTRDWVKAKGWLYARLKPDA
jgi:RNA polymerase sigma factor (TIGR02999 family)